MTTPVHIPVPGEPFPDFALPDAHGSVHTLSGLRGRYVVLYAYPKDDTPGCTKEACDFRDNALLRAHGAAILGISADDADSHGAFAAKYDLPFPLLSDMDSAFLRNIGTFGEKTSFGKVTQGIRRQTFLIDPDGRLVKAWLNVKVDGHADAVAAAMTKDQARHG
ncbi:MULTISPECIES: peroxiredoxin [Deinococcus]|uniref:thioredoxin-dependent peroxiredoxin n=1 Tax=Deinococcus rufus TaxID=2136097 RepID=A0ABV7ZFR7_9DEIO|nr:peroxiredoxin [Deinococcus sp. AB2017081]WQE93900.1 peroxiredoxin [Deinococcus sp. AB2017081]